VIGFSSRWVPDFGNPGVLISVLLAATWGLCSTLRTVKARPSPLRAGFAFADGRRGRMLCRMKTGSFSGQQRRARNQVRIAAGDFYLRPRRPCTGLRRRAVSVSSAARRCADCSSGWAPDLCTRGVRPLRTLSDGAGGFLPGVPLECLDTGKLSPFAAPAYAALFLKYEVLISRPLLTCHSSLWHPFGRGRIGFCTPGRSTER
jgi:hypothetical protein